MRIFKWMLLLLMIVTPGVALAAHWSMQASHVGQTDTAEVLVLVDNDATASEQRDQQLAHAILRSLHKDPIMEMHHMTATVTGGRVYFGGTVHSSVERQRAEEIARETEGITGVVNNLTVEAPKFWRMDMTIREVVEAELARSLYVDRARIRITVDDGIVLLTGFVDSNEERRVATDLAYDAGAQLVVNKLIVASREATNSYE